MNIVTLEGIVEQGKIRLLNEIQLPENTIVFVIIPDIRDEPIGHIYSPRLVPPEQANDFKMEIIKDAPNARI